MLKIILADNQAIFRTGAAKVLAVEDDLRIVAQAENTEKMMMALEKFHATVMIFGVDMHSNLPNIVETGRKFKTKLGCYRETGADSPPLSDQRRARRDLPQREWRVAGAVRAQSGQGRNLG